uniref:Hyaluronidase n=1 Tax=Steinernema glaseri TaxID=37863 RepID=A0A1I7YLX2_9BILA
MYGQTIVGLPDKREYGYPNMNQERQEKFDIWYDANKDRTGNFDKDIQVYCEADVTILRSSWRSQECLTPLSPVPGWWHGHSCANNPQDVILNPTDQKAVEKANIVRQLMGERQARTQARKKDIEAAGYTVFDIWECDINRERKENNELGTFMNEVDVAENFLMPRKAFFGGTTGLCQAIYETD